MIYHLVNVFHKHQNSRGMFLLQTNALHLAIYFAYEGFLMGTIFEIESAVYSVSKNE